MENTIENAREWYTEKWQRSVVLPSINNTENMAILIHEYANLIAEPKDQRIAELEKENADLRRALSECKAKARIGISPENR